jgi:NADP-dependent 3-hydroxy acid dehydrogenase YdfG
MLGFSRQLRQELQDTGVRVTAVMPGATLTRSWEGAGLPPSRFIAPQDIALAVVSAYKMSPSATVEEIIIRPQQGDI